jgi:chromate reductase
VRASFLCLERLAPARLEWSIRYACREFPVMASVHLLLISGSSRHGSTNTAVLKTAQAVTPAEVTTYLYTSLAELPAFNPDDDHDPLPPAVADLRQHLAAADAVLFCTPEYAGGLPGSFKNLLDWTVGGGEMYAKPVAWINASSLAAPTGGADAHASLARVLGYLATVVIDDACVRVVMSRNVIDTDGLIADADIRTDIARVLEHMARHVRTNPRLER